MCESVSLNVFHDHDQLVPGCESRAQLRDVGVLQTGQDLDLTHKAIGQVALLCQIRQQDLHRLRAVGDDIADQVDLAHSAVTQLSNNFVIANLLMRFDHDAPLGNRRVRNSWSALASWKMARFPNPQLDCRAIMRCTEGRIKAKMPQPPYRLTGCNRYLWQLS